MKLRLNLDDFTEDFFEDTRLLGIISAVKNYRFCWQLNNALGYKFRLKTDIEIQLRRKERNYYFPVYMHAVRNSFIKHYLYHNHYDGEYLLPEFRHIDFLWLVKGENMPDEKCLHLIHAIKETNGVQLVIELTNEQIKNKSHLIF